LSYQDEGGKFLPEFLRRRIMKTFLKVLAVVGSLLVVGVLMLAVLGFVAYRNMFPSMDKTEAADAVGKFKLRKVFPVKGNLWGTETNYFLEYETDNGGKKNAITYSMRKFWSESGAIDDFKKAECSRSDSAKEGVLKDKNGNAVGDFRYCSGTLHFRNGSRSATVYTFVLGSSDYAPDGVVIDFVKSLAINSGLDFSSFAPAYPAMISEDQKTVNPASSPDGTLSAFEIVRQQKSGSSVSQYNDREFTVRGYAVSAPTDGSGGKWLLMLYDKADILSDSVSLSCWFDKADRTNFAKIKGKQFVTVKGVFESSTLVRLEKCQLVSVE
jgi:hypothetical protein